MTYIAKHGVSHGCRDERLNSTDVPGAGRATDLLDELIDRFGGTFRPDDIEWQLNNAVLDLAGSIAPESLPEMATRLAILRMQQLASVPSRPDPSPVDERRATLEPARRV